MHRRTILPLIVGLLVWACGDQIEPPSDGTLAVSTATAGEDPDTDGFQLRIDDNDSLALLPSGTAEVALSAGRHTLQLLGVAEHCSVVPGTSVEVDISAGHTAPVTFQVSCPGTSIHVTVTTTGPEPDQDGYRLMIDSVDALALNPTGTAHMNVAPGRHTVELLGVAEQCSVTPGTVLELDFPRGSTTPVTYEVACLLTGARITVTTTGVNLDPDGYRVVVDGSDRGAIPSNGTMLTRLDPGSRTISLAALASNCAFEDLATRTVTIVTAEVAPVEFAVVCIASGPPPPSTTGVLAFSAGNYILALMNADGTNYRELTTPAEEQSDQDAAWSPTGDRIAFSRDAPGGDEFPLAIHLIDRDGTNLVRLSPAGALDYAPAWSPDGQRIAFVNITPGIYQDVAWQIYVMNVDGSHRMPLTKLPRGADTPTWSPDGEKIAFVAASSSEDNFNIYVMDPDGSHVSALTHGPERHYDPAWSPDGRRIVYSNANAIVVIDSDGTNRRRVTSPPDSQWSYHDYWPTWSPDGEWITFTRYHDCDPFNDVGGPPCKPAELRRIELAGEPSASSILVTHGWNPSWGR